MEGRQLLLDSEIEHHNNDCVTVPIITVNQIVCFNYQVVCRQFEEIVSILL